MMKVACLRIVLHLVLLTILSFKIVQSEDGFASSHGGTKGGHGKPVTVPNAAQLRSACSGSNPRVIKITGQIQLHGMIKCGSNKSILAAHRGAGLNGGGLYLLKSHNIVIRGLTFSRSIGGDCINIQSSTNIWIDHNDFSSDRHHGKDYFDGLLDIDHGSDFITVSWNKFHDHYKVSLVGHSDKNGNQDKGKLHVTYHHNYFVNVGSRLPSVRFGVVHVYNNVYENVETSCVHTRMGGDALVENNVFIHAKNPVMTHGDSKQDGMLVERGNNWGGGSHHITKGGKLHQTGYHYHAEDTKHVADKVKKHAGATATF